MKIDNSQETNNSIKRENIYYYERDKLWRTNLVYIIDGIKHRKTFCGKTIEILINRIEEFTEELNLRTCCDLDLRFDNFAMNWMLTKEKYKLKPGSYDTKMSTLTKYVIPAIGHISIAKIKHKDIQNMVNDLTTRGLSYSTVKKAYEVITCCHKHYRSISGQSYNPAEGIELPINIKPDLAEHNYFTFEERQKLEEELSRTYSNGAPVYRFAPVIMLLLYTGIRIGEALALTWDDIDFNENLIDINKSSVYIPVNGRYEVVIQNNLKTDSSMRVLPMSSKAKKALIQLKEISNNSNFVITTTKGKSPTRASIGRSLTRMAKNAGIIGKDETRGAHSLRHTFATMLFENGCSIKIVSELLGHCDTRVTENTYIHIIQKQKIKAIEDLDKYCN